MDAPREPVQNGAAPPAKRQKTSQAVCLGPQLSAKVLTKMQLAFPSVPSPGAMMGSRVAVQVLKADNNGHSALDVRAYVASGKTIYSINSALTANGQSVETGREGMLIPKLSEAGGMTPVPGKLSHAGEIQSIALCSSPLAAGSTDNGACSSYLASVDCYGAAVVRCYSHGSSSSSSSSSTDSDVQFSCAPVRVPEAGWAGLDLQPPASTSSSPLVMATALHFDKSMHLYHNDELVRTFHTVEAPTAVRFLPSSLASPGAAASPSTSGSPLVACGEGHLVTIWDVRQGERGGCVQRVAAAPQHNPLHALSWCEARGGMLGCTGAERAVTLIDPRKWRVAHKWSSCVKYTVNSLEFSRVNPGYAYVAGLDYECVCGRWDGANGATIASGNANSSSGGHGRAVGPSQLHTRWEGGEGEAEATGQYAGIRFRGDSRWMGIARADVPSTGGDAAAAVAGEVLAAYGQSGHLYLAHVLPEAVQEAAQQEQEQQ